MLYLNNSLTRSKEQFIPINADHVKMYVCGPTVYDRAHLGNARSAVVYDTLFRILRALYKNVTYVRNITDVDDKIIAAAIETHSSASNISKIFTKYYQEDMEALHCLPPTVEPKATEHITEVIEIISKLLANGAAYIAENHVLFDIESYSDYGKLSGRSIKEMIAGSRIEVAPYKKNPGDFVLWKPAKPEDMSDTIFKSPYGDGRPGWHIECSAMSSKYLGKDFDIHGGGADLTFPHHENEIAQSKCANKGSLYANYWIHNGFLTINGEKMSKSLGNFKTVRELLDQGIDGAVIRYFYLTTHYHKPLDLNDKAISDAKRAIEKFNNITTNNYHNEFSLEQSQYELNFQNLDILKVLCDDMNTPLAIAYLHELAAIANKGNHIKTMELKKSIEFLGINLDTNDDIGFEVSKEVIELAEARKIAKSNKDWHLADLLRIQVNDLGYTIKDISDGYEILKR